MIKDFLQQIPSYLQTIGAIVKGPKQFFLEADFSSRELYEKALLTAAISIAFSAFFLVRLTHVGYEGESLTLFVLEQIFVYMALYIVYSWVIYTSWYLLGFRQSFRSYLIVALFSLSVSIVFFAFLVLVWWGYTRVNFPEFYIFLQQTALDVNWNGSVPIELQAQAIHATILALGLFFIGLIWFYICWGAYRQMNQASRFKSFSAALISIGIFIPVSLFLRYMQIAVSP